MTPTSQRRRLSASQLWLFTSCQIAWWFSYIERVQQRPSWSMRIGRAVDQVATEAIERILAGEEEMGEVEATELVDERLAAESSSGLPALLTQAEAEHGDEKCRAQAHVIAARLASVYVTQVLPELHPVAVQERIDVELEDYDFDLTCYLDLREEEPEPSQRPVRRVRDLKAKPNLLKGRADSPRQTEADNSTQLTTYALAHEQLTGDLPDELVLDFVVSYKTKDEWKPMATTRAPEDIERVLSRYQRMSEGIEAGVFQPPAEDFWMCAPDRCSYWHACAFGARGRAR